MAHILTVTCHYKKNDNGEWILEREFDDASVALFKIQEDGSIGNLEDLHIIKGKGHWWQGGGQSTSHLHCVQEKENYVYVANRGTDEIEIYKIEENKLQFLSKVQCPFGYAPRHIAIQGEYIFELYENYPVLSLFKRQGDTLLELDRISTMYPKYDLEFPTPVFNHKHAKENEINTCGMADRRRAMPSDVHVEDKYVYVSNRWRAKQGSISVFTVEEDRLVKVDHVPLEGKDPRGFTISKDGKYAFVALCDANIVVAYAINKNA